MRSSFARLLVLWVGSVSAACGGTGASRTDPAPRGNDVVPSASVGYDVHEWGLVRGTAGDILSIGAIAPPVVAEPMDVDKPVLYFHTAAPLQLTSVSVDAHNGAIVEAWPPPGARTGDASQLSWRNLSITPGATCASSPLPRLTDSACTSLPAGDLCEAASLATVRVPGAPCIRLPDGTDSLLFYRARSRDFTPPLSFRRSSAVYERVEVTNEGDLAIPGWLVRLWRDGGRVRALAIRPPAARTSIVVGADFGAGGATDVLPRNDNPPAGVSEAEPGRRAVRETMREIGMTHEEADAFLRAWDPTIFGVGATALDQPPESDRRGAVDELSADGEPAPRETFLYFLPGENCDRIARLAFDPPPRNVRRAIAVWSTLRATGASR